MMRTLEHGTQGVEAAVLRAMLGMPDGDTYDADALTKVMAGQRACGLVVDGIVGPDTWRAIAKTAKPLKLGAKGAKVRALQCLLDNGKSPTGVFDAKTKAAVAAYQKTVGIKVVGRVGPKTWAALIVGPEADQSGESGVLVPSTGKYGKPKDFKQGAKPWGPKMYSSRGDKKQTYANSACGPTSMADIVYSMKDKSVTPETLGVLAVKHGYRTASSGTAWAFFKFIANLYKFSRFTQTKSLATAKAAIDSGALIVASMGPGYWTKAGHFICVYDYDGTYIYANDPASRTRKRQAQDDFAKQCKQLFIFWP